MLQLGGARKSEQLNANLFSSAFPLSPNVRECSHSYSVETSRCTLNQETHSIYFVVLLL